MVRRWEEGYDEKLVNGHNLHYLSGGYPKSPNLATMKSVPVTKLHVYPHTFVLFFFFFKETSHVLRIYKKSYLIFLGDLSCFLENINSHVVC